MPSQVVLLIFVAGRMVLPFEPLTITFQHLQYYVDAPLVIMRNLIPLKKKKKKKISGDYEV